MRLIIMAEPSWKKAHGNFGKIKFYCHFRETIDRLFFKNFLNDNNCCHIICGKKKKKNFAKKIS